MTSDMIPMQPFLRPADVGQVSAILDAAEGCFSRSGYAGAAMREIADRAGVSKSLLHYHFHSKEHLFVEVQMRAYERLATRVAAAVAPSASGKERALQAFDVFIAAIRESDDLKVQSELWAGALSDAKLRAHVVRLREFFRDLLIRTSTEVLGQDLHRVGLSAEQTGDLLWATLNGIGIESAFSDARERGDRAVQAFRRLAELALGGDGHAASEPVSGTVSTKRSVAPSKKKISRPGKRPQRTVRRR